MMDFKRQHMTVLIYKVARSKVKHNENSDVVDASWFFAAFSGFAQSTFCLGLLHTYCHLRETRLTAACINPSASRYG